MEFLREEIAKTWNEARDLLSNNHEETGLFEPEDFNPSVDKYCALEHEGMAKLFTARHEGNLIGYGVYLVVRHLHYENKVFAMQDTLYVDPAFRGAESIEFIKFMDHELYADGVDVILRQVTVKKDYSDALISLGYNEVETSYIRTKH